MNKTDELAANNNAVQAAAGANARALTLLPPPGWLESQRLNLQCDRLSIVRVGGSFLSLLSCLRV